MAVQFLKKFHANDKLSKNCRVAVIGCGAVAENSHLPALADLGIVPVLLIDKNPQRARSLANKFGVSKTSDDYQKCLDEFDAAIVALPHHLHAPVCIDLLSRGIHVLVEKPMAANFSQCDCMIVAARDGQSILSVGLMRRFFSTSQWVKSVLAAGLIGEVESFDIREGFVYNWPVASDFFFHKETAGGGVLLDTGGHTLDLMLWWFGDVKSFEYYDDSYGGVEADCELHLNMMSGAKGTVELSRTRTLRNTVIIRGKKGELEVSLFENQIEKVSPRDLLQFNRGNRLTGSGGLTGVKIKKLIQNLFVLEIQNWLRAIEKNNEPLVSAREASKSIALIESCYERRQDLNFPWVKIGERTDKFPNKKDSVQLSGKKVLITGATGFIGSRLVEKLILFHDADVRALVRTFANASRIARFPIEIVGGDIVDTDSVSRAVAGCGIVFHCAHDFKNPQRNLDGAKVLAEACLKHKIERFVYISSVSVYEPLPDGDLDESLEAKPCGWDYPDNKLAMEQTILRYTQERGLPAVIVLPTIVYGPFSGAWTTGPVKQLLSGKVVLPDDGKGLCNAVYVDDVVDALILAAQKDGVIGERFLISGAAPVTWREYFAAYERILGTYSTTFMPADELRRLSQGSSVVSKVDLIRRDPLQILRRWESLNNLVISLKRKIGVRIWKKIKRLTPPPLVLPNEQTLCLYNARCNVRIDKAKSMLGYACTFGFEQGMELTEQFIKWTGMI